MTTWKPDFAPYLEIHQDLFANASGVKTVYTGFNKVQGAKPIMIGSTPHGLGIGPSIVRSGGAVTVYFRNYSDVYVGSQKFDLYVYGVK